MVVLPIPVNYIQLHHSHPVCIFAGGGVRFRPWCATIYRYARQPVPQTVHRVPDAMSLVQGARRLCLALALPCASLRHVHTHASYYRSHLKTLMLAFMSKFGRKKTMHCYTYMRYLLRVSGTKMRAQLSITYTVGGDAKRRPHQLVLGRRDAHERILDHVPSPTSHLRPNRETPATDENFVPASASEHRQDGKVSTRGRRPGTLSR